MRSYGWLPFVDRNPSYDQLSVRAALEAIPGFRWCLGKNCKSGQVHEEGSQPKFRCVACRATHCVVHGVPWHKGETCAEYGYRYVDTHSSR
jgi:hypothetical protein